MATAKKKAPAKKAAPVKKAASVKTVSSKKPKSQTPEPPIQGPPGRGQYRITFSHAGKSYTTLGGRGISYGPSGANGGPGMGGVTPRAGGGPLNRGK
jgi:hypothetical protein